MSILDLVKYRFDTKEWAVQPGHPDEETQEVLDDEDWSLAPNTQNDWAANIVAHHNLALAATVWYLECSLAATTTLKDAIEIDRNRRGGLPVLYGTGFTVSQLLAELAESSGVEEVSDNFDLKSDTVKSALVGLSLLMQRPFTK